MDLKNYIPNKEDLVVELQFGTSKLTNEDGSPMTMTFMSPFSKDYKKMSHAYTQELIEKSRLNGNDQDSFDTDEVNLELLIRSCKSWNITWDGKKPKFSQDKAREILEELSWLQGYIESKRYASLNFMKV